MTLRGMAGLVFVLLAGTLPACGQSPPSSMERIHQAGVLRVCSTGDYRPFTFRDAQGRWSGLDVDLAGNLAARWNVTLRWVPTTWSTLLDDVAAGCDVAMGGITVTAERARRARFSVPYLSDGKAAAVRCADAVRYRSLADVDRPGVRVVVNPGGTNAEFDHANLSRAVLVEYPDNNTIFEQLIDGRADVMITDASEVRWQTARHPQLCGVGVDHPFTHAQKAYLVPPADAATQRAIDEWLGVITSDGTYAAVSRRWLGGVVGT